MFRATHEEACRGGGASECPHTGSETATHPESLFLQLPYFRMNV